MAKKKPIKNTIKIIFLFIVVISFWSTLLWGSPFSLIDKYLNFSENSLIIKNTTPVSYLSSGNQSLCRAYPPKERTIIFRLDDVQGYLWNKIVINITNTVLAKNMSITLAVISNRSIDKDPLINNFLVDKVKDPRVEIAQHGTDHTYYEYPNLTEEETYSLAKIGLDKIIDVLNVRPVTFIPPNNELNENNTQAFSRLGIKIISGKKGDYDFNGEISKLGYDTLTKYSANTSLIPIRDIILACNNSFARKNICIIMIHPQDYIDDDNKTMNGTRYFEFTKLLGELTKTGAKFSTFKDLIKCQ